VNAVDHRLCLLLICLLLWTVEDDKIIERMLVEGYSYRQIALTLGRTRNAVIAHQRRLTNADSS
jgi:hypothetical protein